MANLQKKSTETILKEAQTLGLLDKDFKSIVLNMVKELKKTRRTMYEKWILLLKSQTQKGAKAELWNWKCNNWNEKTHWRASIVVLSRQKKESPN